MAAQDSDVTQVMSMVHSMLSVPEIQKSLERDLALVTVLEMHSVVKE